MIMKKIAGLYIDEHEARITLVDPENLEMTKFRKIKLEQNFSKSDAPSLDGEFTDELDLDSLSQNPENMVSDELGDFLNHLDKRDYLLLPVASQPEFKYNFVFRENGELKKEEIIKQLKLSGEVHIERDNTAIIEYNNRYLAGYINGDGRLTNMLAEYTAGKNSFVKIPCLLSAELSIVEHIASKSAPDPEQYSLIIHVGNELSKLIFMKGTEIIHIGENSPIGVKNMVTHDVYFPKILLEMENGDIPRLDNIFVCGKDSSEKFQISLYGLFPEAKVRSIDFDEFGGEKGESGEYAIPLAATEVYIRNQGKKGNYFKVLPQWIEERQKLIQVSWHSLLVLPLLFAAAFWLTNIITGNNKVIDQLSWEIMAMEQVGAQNRTVLDEIQLVRDKINKFESTYGVLGEVSRGAGKYTHMLRQLSGYASNNRGLWLNSFDSPEGGDIVLTGYCLNRQVLTRMGKQIPSVSIKSINHQELRELNLFNFIITSQFPGEVK